MDGKKDVLHSLAMITQVGISMLAPVVLCVFIGSWLDGKFDLNTTVFLLILGILAGGRNCWLLLKSVADTGDHKKGVDKND